MLAIGAELPQRGARVESRRLRNRRVVSLRLAIRLERLQVERYERRSGRLRSGNAGHLRKQASERALFARDGALANHLACRLAIAVGSPCGSHRGPLVQSPPVSVQPEHREAAAFGQLRAHTLIEVGVAILALEEAQDGLRALVVALAQHGLVQRMRARQLIGTALLVVAEQVGCIVAQEERQHAGSAARRMLGHAQRDEPPQLLARARCELIRAQ